jgi:two-component system response regulator DegU
LEESNQLEELRETLTTREQKVLSLAGRGELNSKIASILSLSEITVKHHLTQIFKKLKIENRTQLVRLCMEHEVFMQSKYGLKIHN